MIAPVLAALILLLAGSDHRGHHPTRAELARAQRDPWFAERLMKRTCPNGTNDWDDNGPVCD